MKTISRYIMTLALLLTAVTGAWATTDPNSVYWDYQTWKGWAESVTTHTVGDITITATGSGKVYQSTSSGEPLALQAGANDAITFTSNGKPFASIAIITGDELNVAGWTYNSSTWSYEWSGEPTTSVTLSGCEIKADVITFTFGTAEAPITVEPGSSANTWTFAMPGSDVVLTPIYAKAAAFATTGTEPEVKTLLPAAAEGVIAGTDASLIAEGTGIVAFAGTSTEVKQGTVMYAVTPASVTDASELISSDWKNTVPTAKNIADKGAEVKVWYYIQGADAPEGEAATLDNTFNDSEICTTPLTVTVRSNKFDLAFKAANANTIEAGKATVTVGGTAATVTDGKLEGVKMGSEVKMTAAPGYKFKSVTAVKKAAVTYPLLSAATTDDVGKVVCADGHLHDAKTAVPDGCTAVGILSKVTETGHGLILALKDAAQQIWPTINGWTSVTTYASTTLKKVPDAARGSLTSYTTLGETTVSDWAVAQYEDYKAIFTNLGSTTAGNTAGKTYDGNVNAYITTGVGGTAMSGNYWSATPDGDRAWYFRNDYWTLSTLKRNRSVRPVLGF